MRDDGLALLSVLLILVGVFALTTTLFFSTFLDARAVSNIAAGDDALYGAEAGIQHVWALLDPAPDFSRAFSWPGGQPPFGSPVAFPEPPHTYRVLVSALPDGSLRAVSEGTSYRGARRKVEAIFFRELPFRPPAALTIARGTRLAEVGGTLDLTVEDSDRDRVPLGAEARDDAMALSAARGGEVVATVGSSGLAEAAERLRDSAGLILDGPQTTGTYGSSESPTSVRFVGQADVDGVVSITGIVLADAPLRVRGRLEIEGVLLAAQGLDVEGEVVVRGAAWAASELRIASGAAVRVVYQTTPLDGAARVGGAVLPRNTVLGAWREVW
jgi:hypothetical protein